MVIDYMRVSTKERQLERQTDALANYDCAELLTEKLSGTKKGVNLVFIKENFDTDIPRSRLMLTMFQVMAEFERDLKCGRFALGNILRQMNNKIMSNFSILTVAYNNADINNIALSANEGFKI